MSRSPSANPFRDMSDPTHTHDPSDGPNTDPGTRSAATHSRAGEPDTATVPLDARPAEPFHPPPGFEIVRELGSGGMGVVYEAVQRTLNRRVALKVLAARRGDLRDLIRFRT